VLWSSASARSVPTRKEDGGRLRWSLDNPQPELALRIASALSVYWSVRHLHREAASWLGSALDQAGPAAAPAMRAEALHSYAYSLIDAGTMCALAAVLRQSHRVDEAYRCASGSPAKPATRRRGCSP
jgi:hypothetical protein